MKIFKKILFPVDFSEVSPKIVPWVSSMAKKFRSEIHLLFVAHRLAHLSGIYVEAVSIQHFENDIIRGAERNIGEFAQIYP